MPRAFRSACLVFAFVTSASLAGGQLPNQTAPDPGMRHGLPPPDTRLTQMEQDQRRDAAANSSFKVAFGRKSQEWTPAMLAPLPHETLKTLNVRTQAEQTYAGVPLMALLVELGVPQKPKGKDFRLYVLAEGRDGNKVVYSLGEVSPDVHNGSVLLVDSIDGKPLADNGPIELVCSGERTPARWVRGLVSIKVQAAD
jgi:hypothetical protein